MKIGQYVSHFANRVFENREHYPRPHRGIVFARKYDDSSGWYGYNSEWVLSPIFTNQKHIYMKRLKEQIERAIPSYISDSEKATKMFLDDRQFDIKTYELFEKLPDLDLNRHLTTGVGGLKLAKIMIDESLRNRERLEDEIQKIIRSMK